VNAPRDRIIYEPLLIKEATRAGRLIGSIWVDKKGYVFVKTNNGQKPVHRLIMEAFLKRELNPGESVHHKNGDRSDNRLSNLELRYTTYKAHGYGMTHCRHCGGLLGPGENDRLTVERPRTAL